MIWKGKITPPVNVQSPAAAHDPRCYFDVAEMEGFEPPGGVTRQLISSQPRYDHFDTSPYSVSILPRTSGLCNYIQNSGKNQGGDMALYRHRIADGRGEGKRIAASLRSPQ